MLADPKEKCGKRHLFDVYKKKLGIRCRCGQYKGDFDYITGFNLTMRVTITKKIDFRGVN